MKELPIVNNWYCFAPQIYPYSTMECFSSVTLPHPWTFQCTCTFILSSFPSKFPVILHRADVEVSWNHTLKVCAGDNAYYYTHFKITGDPCNLIGSQYWDLFGYLTVFFFFALNHICCKLHHFCCKSHHLCSRSHHFCFEYKVRSVKAFLFPLFNKPATRSIKFCFWLNSVISKLF